MPRAAAVLFILMTFLLGGLFYAFHLQMMRDVQVNREELRANTEAVQHNSEALEQLSERNVEAIHTFSARKPKPTPTVPPSHDE